jgi:hypothetical protein
MLIFQYGSQTILGRSATFSDNVLTVETPTFDPELASVSTETEDDPVNLAMRTTIGGQVFEDIQRNSRDESLVWPQTIGIGERRAYHSLSDPHAVPGSHNGSFGPVLQPRAASLNAQDLLSGLTLLPAAPVTARINPAPRGTSPGPPRVDSRRDSDQQQQQPQQQQANQQWLYGGGGESGSSIWTMTREESEKGRSRGSVPNSNPNGNLQAVADLWSAPGPGQVGVPKVAVIAPTPSSRAPERGFQDAFAAPHHIPMQYPPTSFKLSPPLSSASAVVGTARNQPLGGAPPYPATPRLPPAHAHDRDVGSSSRLIPATPAAPFNASDAASQYLAKYFAEQQGVPVTSVASQPQAFGAKWRGGYPAS